MTPELLTRLRSWLSADESQYECRLSVNEVREIVGELERGERDSPGAPKMRRIRDVFACPHCSGQIDREVGVWTDQTLRDEIARLRGEKPQEPEAGEVS